MEVKRPNKRNIELGDFLVVSSANERDPVEMLEIKAVNSGTIRGDSPSGHRTSFRKYDNAVVLKKDGTYLVGRKVYAEATR